MSEWDEYAAERARKKEDAVVCVMQLMRLGGAIAV